MTTGKIPQNITANEPAPALSAPRPDVEVDICPDGGYGWVQVGVGFTINAFTWGQTAVRNHVSRSRTLISNKYKVLLDISRALPLA